VAVALPAVFYHALQGRSRVWEQLLVICHGSAACLNVMLHEEQTASAGVRHELGATNSSNATTASLHFARMRFLLHC
jgi:hypothetical protein